MQILRSAIVLSVTVHPRILTVTALASVTQTTPVYNVSPVTMQTRSEWPSVRNVLLEHTTSMCACLS